MEMSLKRLKEIYDEFRKRVTSFQTMTDYYENRSDAMKNYKMITDRSSLKTNTNFIKLFVDEEVSYSLGNDITYTSREGNQEFLDEVTYALGNLSESHDVNLLESMLIHSIAYELYYIDRKGDFAAKVIPATEGYAVLDQYGEVELFLHVYKRLFDKTTYIDIYTDNYIYHLTDKWVEVRKPSKHIFGRVPVGIATWDKERDQRHKTIFSVSKGLQDAYETNMSDLSNEISDFRNAYMVFEGVGIDDEDLPKMKKNGIIQTPRGEVKWLMKDLQGTFIHDTLDNIEDKLYQMNGHINRNDTGGRNESFLAIEARNMTLQSKCKLNQKALEDCIRTRIEMLVISMNIMGVEKDYDARDIKPIFIANLPSDDYSTAEMIEKLGDKISTQTAISQLSFIEDSTSELEKIRKELIELHGGDYHEDFED